MTSGDEDGTRVPVSHSFKSAAMQEPEDAVDFFRKKKSMAQILEEKKRRAAAKKKKSERRRSSQTTSVERVDAGVQDSKRRKVSGDDDEDGFEGGLDGAPSHRSVSPTMPSGRNSRSKSDQTKEPHGSPTTLSGKYSQLTGSKSKSRTPQPADILSLSDSDDDVFGSKKVQPENNVNIIDDDDDDGPGDAGLDIHTTNGERNDEPSNLENDPESEDEFAYLVARAREKAAKAKESKPETPAANNTKTQQEIIDAKIKERLEQYRKTGSLAKSVSDGSNTPKKAAAVTSKPTPPLVDPKVEILVTSTIEGTKPLMFIRKLSQRLKEVRLSWCDRQEIGWTDSQKESIFLTWKGTKLFDSTTCQRMPGLSVHSGKVDTDGEGFADGKLHMEAWTPETFQEFQKGKALGRPTYAEYGEEEEEEREPTPEPEQEEKKWRLVLKARGIDDFKLVVKGQTRIAKIISSFQSERNIGEDKEISLRFDGDLLEPEALVQDMDFEDYDAIEVLVK